MPNSDTLANELFLLMLNLSQLKDRKRIFALFMEALEGRIGGLSLTYEPDGEKGEDGVVVATTHTRFGVMHLGEEARNLDPGARALVHNAIRMLALILENRLQDEILQGENRALDQVVAQRTIELTEINERLRREVFQRAKAETALKKSEERLRLALDAAQDGLWDWDFETGKVFWSPRSYTMLGYEPGEFQVTFDKWREMIHPDDRDEAQRRVMEQMTSGGRTFTIEFRYAARDGSWRWIIGRGKAVEWDAEGNVLRVVGTHVDITDRKAAEERELENERRWRIFFDNNLIGICFISAGGRITDANQAFLNAIGRQAAELAGGGVDWDSVWRGEPGKEGRGALEAMLKRGVVNPLEGEFLRPDGIRVPVLLGGGVFKESDGTMVAYAIDLTEQRSERAERMKLEAQLRQSQKMEAIGTLAGGVAHDFNNLLTAILGFAELAQEANDEGQKNDEEIRQIVVASERARDLVRQILTFSRKAEPRLLPVNLNREVTQTAEVLSHTLPKMISLETRLEDNLGMVDADPVQINQVLLNLGSNAADAMPQGGRLIMETANVDLDETFCRQHLEVQPGSYVRLRVSDTGLGMDKRTQEQIFDPFFTTKGPGKGTGLGLSTVFGIIKSHGGHIYCYSEPGRGTVFNIYLPSRDGLLRDALDRLARPENLPRGTETVLLVDDEPSLRHIGETILGNAGYRVKTAGSGEEALEAWRSAPARPDLVILDLGMPGMGGRRCLEELLKMDPEARVLVASGYAEQALVRDTLAAGALGFLPKPFRKQDLLTQVRQVLDRAAAP